MPVGYRRFHECTSCPPPAFVSALHIGRATHEAAIEQLLHQGRAKLVASTLGSEGCIVVSRCATTRGGSWVSRFAKFCVWFSPESKFAVL